MTRIEQIDEFANSQVDCEFFNEDLYKGIIIGAKWADEHPKPDMVNKQEFIERTWQWLKAHIKIETVAYSDVWDVSVVDVLVTDFNTVDEMEESFRKIMKE